MAIKTPAYFKWRNGRPRWEPGPGVRRLGFKGRDLKDASGAWLELGPAIAAAGAANAEVADYRASGKKPTRHTSSRRTVRALYEHWRASTKYTLKAPKTQHDYLNKAGFFLAEFGEEMLSEIEPHHLYTWWEELHRARGHAMANGILAVARLILSHAPRIGWRRDNPARQLGLDGVPPRVVVWSPSEVEAFVATADALGLTACADAVVIALHTGQRQGDVLALEEQKIEGGAVYFLQGKTRARVAVPHTDQLAARLDMIRRRRRAIDGPIDLSVARRVVLRADGRTYTKSLLAKDFRHVRALVAAAQPEIAEKTFQDLRDTAVTRLALADCTVPMIRAITGHTLTTVHQVLEHYLAIDDRMAAAGIDKLKQWMRDEGIAV